MIYPCATFNSFVPKKSASRRTRPIENNCRPDVDFVTTKNGCRSYALACRLFDIKKKPSHHSKTIFFDNGEKSEDNQLKSFSKLHFVKKISIFQTIVVKYGNTQ